MNVDAWQAWYGAIPSDVIDNMIKVCDTYPLQEPHLGADVNNSVTDQSYRRSEIAWIPPHTQDTHHITYEIAHRAYEANRNAWGFNLGPTVNDIQYTKYYGSAKGYYNWHIDTFFVNNTKAYDRKISVIIQLSDSDEYEGGDFKFDGEVPAPDPQLLRQKGTVLVFPSYIRHMVEPVTSGERKSIVSWIEGPRFI